MRGRALALFVALLPALGIAAGCGGSGPSGVDAGDGDADVNGPDGGEPDARPAVACDPLVQDGCESGEKCSIVPPEWYGDPSTIECVGGGGTLGAFEACTSATFTAPDGCAPGLVCVGTAAPRCLPFCTDVPEDTCGTGEVCAFTEDLDGDWLVDVMFCALTCDLFLQDCADAEFACYPMLQGPICGPEGAGETPAQVGDPCEYANSCAEGLGCFRIGVSLEWLCFKICDPYGTGGPICELNQVCNPVGDEVWGVCIDES